MSENLEAVVPDLQKRVAASKDEIIKFLREIVAIPSFDSQIKAVGERIGGELRGLGFDEVRFDKMGNILGRIGNGPRVIVMDSHIDTVGIGDPGTWEWDPFEGKVEDGVLYARGACDEKGSTPGMVYGLAIARDLGLLESWTAYYFGNMEEWCDGIAPNTFVEVDPGVRPDFVVIGEPTRMQVYRGHKGRVEMKVAARTPPATTWAIMPSTSCCPSSRASATWSRNWETTNFWATARSPSATCACRLPASTPSPTRRSSTLTAA
jgi:putative selenium metabolism hydrolase